MKNDELSDLAAFVAVAEESSFTRAAARLDTSQSALSYTMRRLEARLGVRLLNRTTRRVAPTAAGETLLMTLRPALSSISGTLAELSQLQQKPAGTVRLSCSAHAARTVLWPAVAAMVPHHPGLKIEIAIDAALTDIVAERFDAGVRLGEQLDADMVAVRIGPELRMAVVASPDYLRKHGVPQTPHDLTAHACINVRLPSSGGLYAWEFEKEGRALNVRVDGPLVFNEMDMVLVAAVASFGIAFALEDQVTELISAGTLVRLLGDWCPAFPGYHLYYPSRRQPSAAFTLLVSELRSRADEVKTPFPIDARDT